MKKLIYIPILFFILSCSNLLKTQPKTINQSKVENIENEYKNHYDTTVARLINEKINEYRISKGLYNLIQTDRYKSETEQYCAKAAQKITETNIIEHSSLFFPGKWSEIICSVPFNGAELSADSLANRVVTAYINSRPHHVAILSIGVTKIHTSVYIYYNPKQKDWKLFTASHTMDWEYELDLKYSAIKLEY